MNRILHFGPGNFFRAHLADYTFDAGGWRITGVSLRSPTIRDGLRGQDFCYALAVQGEHAKHIDVIDHVHVAPEDPEAVLRDIRDPDVHIISATVTEKGYHLTAQGALDLNDPIIAKELDTRQPASLIGYLAFGLSKRTSPVTVLSCDNRSGNGDALWRAIQEFSAAAGLELPGRVTCPNAMVDRITPATTDALRAAVNDPMAVPCEAFREWVIEDRFAGPRPDWPGVQFVRDVAPHELRKLRMLNGAHSYLAYAGTLRGFDYVHEAIADPGLRQGTLNLMSEAAETLPDEVREQAPAYARDLINRFENPHLNHRLRQIAMDGSEKVPYRLVNSLRALKEQGRSAHSLSEAVRAWIAFCIAETQAGRLLEDPRADALAKAAKSEDPTNAILQLIAAEDLIPMISA